MIPEKTFWQGKRVFITGHTGFKGAWLSHTLLEFDAVIKGYALEANQPSLFEATELGEQMKSEISDICHYQSLLESITSFKPEIVIHMAAQALVRESYLNPITTYNTNVMGTVHLLEACRRCDSVRAIVVVSSDKCYENKEWIWSYRESDELGGYDPYSSSKGCTEMVASAYRQSFFNPAEFNIHRCAVASVRAGNVIGGGDWAKDRLVPDALEAFSKGKKVSIRSPHATRPWQHVLEPLNGYLTLAEKLFNNNIEYAEAWNFGPGDNDAREVQWVVGQLANHWANGADWAIEGEGHSHEASYLKLDCSKACQRLDWYPVWNINVTMEKIVAWHKAWLGEENMNDYTRQEIRNFYAEKHSIT